MPNLPYKQALLLHARLFVDRYFFLNDKDRSTDKIMRLRVHADHQAKTFQVIIESTYIHSLQPRPVKHRLYPLGAVENTNVLKPYRKTKDIDQVLDSYMQILQDVKLRGGIEADEYMMHRYFHLRYPVGRGSHMVYDSRYIDANIALSTSLFSRKEKLPTHCAIMEPLPYYDQTNPYMVRQIDSGRATFVRREPFSVALIRPSDPELPLHIASGSAVTLPHWERVTWTLEHFPLLAHFDTQFRELLPPDTILLADVVPYLSLPEVLRYHDVPMTREERINYVRRIASLPPKVATDMQEKEGYLCLSVWDIPKFAGHWVAESQPYDDRMGTVLDIAQSIESGTITLSYVDTLQHLGQIPEQITSLDLSNCPPCLVAAPSVDISYWSTNVRRDLTSALEEQEWDRIMAVDGSYFGQLPAVPLMPANMYGDIYQTVGKYPFDCYFNPQAIYVEDARLFAQRAVPVQPNGTPFTLSAV